MNYSLQQAELITGKHESKVLHNTKVTWFLVIILDKENWACFGTFEDKIGKFLPFNQCLYFLANRDICQFRGQKAQKLVFPVTLYTNFSANIRPIFAPKVSKEVFQTWLQYSLEEFYQHNRFLGSLGVASGVWCALDSYFWRHLYVKLWAYI